MKKTRGRLLSLVLAVLLCVAVLPTGSARAMGDAMSLDQVKALMNAETLYPQKTGYLELDRMLEELVAPYKGKDTYTTLKGLYDWTVNNIDYSWDGYSQNYAPAYDRFTLTYDLTYETGLPQAYPIDMIYRAYHMLTARTGVCYDWGILFAVMARYVGVESYVHTGILRIGTWTGHHGWTELRLGGKNYIFDGQQDWRSKGIYGRIVYDHFGISMDNAWYLEDVMQASEQGLVSGMSEAFFEPKGTMNRAMFATLLYKLEGAAGSEGEGYFEDVAPGAWYAGAVNWAYENGVVHGMSETEFAPLASVNREQAATMVVQYLESQGITSDAEEVDFADSSDISGYAVETIAKAQDLGILYGYEDNTIRPKNTLSRAEGVALLMNLVECLEAA